jgi:ubiquinone/menaquinone biosynthesis C-methylase UbiE
MNERTYNNTVDRLRSAERLERVEAKRVADLCLEGLTISSMLDIGTGSALFAEEFYKRNISAAGIDLNPEMIKMAQSVLPDCEFKLSTAEEIPFDDKSFDLVFLGLVFHEVDDYAKALLEAKRLARVSVSILEWPYRTEEAGPPIEHRLKEEFVKNLAEKTGFSKIEVYPLKQLVLYKIFI